MEQKNLFHEQAEKIKEYIQQNTGMAFDDVSEDLRRRLSARWVKDNAERFRCFFERKTDKRD